MVQTAVVTAVRRCIAVFCGVLALAAITSACGSDPGNTRPGAAEPATAPATTTTPTGTVRPVGSTPEGIVYDARSDLVAVAVRDPDRLLLLDPASFAVRRSVPLPGEVRHLQVGTDGSVLVPVESANQFAQVALPGGTVRATDVRKQPHDAAQTGNGDIVVGDEFGKSISVVRDGRSIRTITDLTQPGGVVATGATSVAVVDVGAFTVSTYDLATFRRTARVSAGSGPTHGALLSGNRVVVTDTRGDRVRIFSLSPLREVASLRLPGTPYGLAVDRTTNTAWVTLTARNQLVGLDVSGTTPRVIARYPTVRQPNTVAVAPGATRLWVTGTADGVVQLITR